MADGGRPPLGWPSGPCGLYSGKPIGAAACGWKAARCSESLPPLVSFGLEMEGHFQELHEPLDRDPLLDDDSLRGGV